jgi:branched-chain amino acid transport system ATP-binding protein
MTDNSNRTLLRVTGLDVYYGPICALRDIDIDIERGEIVCLLGGNASGKTTTMKAMLGVLKPSKGTLIYEGTDITQWSTTRRVKEGIIPVPEGRQLFPAFTVEENLLSGAYTRGDQVEIQRDLQAMYERFPKLAERRRQKAGTLSGGEQQIVATARALMGRPKLMCMDEPSMGLAPILVQENFDLIREISEQGTTVFVVEQNANMALSIADRGYVLQTGEIVLSGTAKELRENEMLRAAYLGDLCD